MYDPTCYTYNTLSITINCSITIVNHHKLPSYFMKMYEIIVKMMMVTLTSY